MESCIVYLSSATKLLSQEEVFGIVEKSQKNNRAAGITGVLLYFNGSFLQVLEGQQERVNQLYALIQADYRHTHLIELYNKPIERRSFGDWLMGYKVLSALDLGQLGDVLPNAGPPSQRMEDQQDIVRRIVQIYCQYNYRN